MDIGHQMNLLEAPLQVFLHILTGGDRRLIEYWMQAEKLQLKYSFLNNAKKLQHWHCKASLAIPVTRESMVGG